MFLLPWAPKRGAFMAKGRHSTGRHRGWGEAVAPNCPPRIHHCNNISNVKEII